MTRILNDNTLPYHDGIALTCTHTALFYYI